jgi:hypothetical protein
MKRIPKDKTKTWVSNEEADRVISAVHNLTKINKLDTKTIQHMMDLIVSVENYNIDNIHKQGIISKIFNKEKLNGHNGKTVSNHFGYDIKDMISIFWEEVFKSLPKAEVRGTNVSVREVEGILKPDDQPNNNGYKIRQTNCNPIYYLRNRGVMAVRNALNESYRTNIKQICNSCGTQQASTTSEAKSNICPKCKSTDTVKYWPDGHASYKSKKGRRCNLCGNIWTRVFGHICYKCGSDDMRADSKLISQDDTILQMASNLEQADTVLITEESEARLDKILDEIYKALPTDPKNPTIETKTQEVFRLLIYPSASKEMCKRCNEAAPKVCEEKCEQSGCQHIKIPDPNVCCGAESYNNRCINYSKKIGEYHNCSASLAARRVKKVREYFIRYIVANKEDMDCETLYKLLDKYGLL